MLTLEGKSYYLTYMEKILKIKKKTKENSKHLSKSTQKAFMCPRTLA